MTDGYFDRFINSTRAIYTSIALIFVGIVGWYYLSPSSFLPSPSDPEVNSTPVENVPSSQKSAQAPVSRNSISEPTAPPKPVPQPSEIELRIATAKNEMFRESVSKLTTKSEFVSTEMASLLTQLKDLESNEVGRKIAKVPNSVKGFVSYRELASKLDEQVSNLRAEIKIYGLEIQRAVEVHPDQAIPDSLKSTLQKFSNSVDDMAKSVDTNRIGLDALISSGSQSQPSDYSLAEAIKMVEAEDRKRLVDAKNNERAKELQAKADEVAKAEHETKLAAVDAEKARIKAEQLAIETKRKADAFDAERKRSLMLLEADFQRDLPKINHYLGPLFKSSTKQPQGTATKEEKASGPVSLSALMASGVGNPDVRKACGSLLLFFSNTNAGGRGKGPYEALYYGAALTDAQLDRVRPGYDLLDKYGLLLVDKGMLAK